MKLVEMSYTEMAMITRYQLCIDEMWLPNNTITRSSAFRSAAGGAKV